MEKIVFSNKIKTLFFVGFLIIFAFFLFNQNVFATTAFADVQITANLVNSTTVCIPASQMPLDYNYTSILFTDEVIGPYPNGTSPIQLSGGPDHTCENNYNYNVASHFDDGDGYYVINNWYDGIGGSSENYWAVVEVNGSIVSIVNPFTSNLPVCGSDDGLIIGTAPTNLCEAGDPTTPIFDGTKWDWDCQSGVVSEVCRAYASTADPINGTCGVWNGLDFDTWPDTSELCGISASLIVPSMLETLDTFTWTCSGFNGGTSSYCSADKTTPAIFPELPTGSLDDCSSLGIPEVWFCNISNTIKSIFLPSAEKITELNETINKISGRFPFSYINMANNVIKEVSSGITESEGLSLSILGSESQSVNFADIPFIKIIKIFSTILITFLFLFWLRSFIIHIF